jgi:hypothetical protein
MPNSYAEIVVVTRAPMDSGNMAMNLDTYIQTEQASESNDWKGKIERFSEWIMHSMDRNAAIGIMLSLRQPVFHVGEILFLDSIGRSVIGTDRKPDKWDVDVQTVDTLEEAIALSRSLTHDIEGVPWDQESQS